MYMYVLICICEYVYLYTIPVIRARIAPRYRARAQVWFGLYTILSSPIFYNLGH